MSTKIVHEIVKTADVDLASESRADFEPVDFSDSKNTILKLAGAYIYLINEQIEKKDHLTPDDREHFEYEKQKLLKNKFFNNKIKIS